MSARIICIANQKGGVGKTTTAINLAASLAAAEKSILLIDIDPQANASSGMGAIEDDQYSVYDVLIGEAELPDILVGTHLPTLKLAPSSSDLYGAEVELIDEKGREVKLKAAITMLKDSFDYIFIDCPPSLGLLTINALTACDSVLIPLQCEYYALEGLGQLNNTIELVNRSLNPELAIEGILLTMSDKRNNLSNQVEDEVRSHFGQLVYETVIPRNVRLSEAPSHGLPIILYDIASRGAQSYLSLAQEMIERRRS
jgi:chromosome partitioning protein